MCLLQNTGFIIYNRLFYLVGTNKMNTIAVNVQELARRLLWLLVEHVTPFRGKLVHSQCLTLEQHKPEVKINLSV